LSKNNLNDNTRDCSDILTEYSILMPIIKEPTSEELIFIQNIVNDFNFEIINKNGLWLKIFG
jgi:hypothetical protein